MELCIRTSHVRSLNEFLPVYFQTVIGEDKLYLLHRTGSDCFQFIAFSHHAWFAKFILIFWLWNFSLFCWFLVCFVVLLYCIFYFCLVVVVSFWFACFVDLVFCFCFCFVFLGGLFVCFESWAYTCAYNNWFCWGVILEWLYFCLN